jgi:hypothetical protein
MEGAEPLRGLMLALRNLRPEIGDAFLHRRIGERLHNRGIELGDDGLRRALGRAIG